MDNRCCGAPRSPECLRQNLFKAQPFQGQLGVSNTSAKMRAFPPAGGIERAAAIGGAANRNAHYFSSPALRPIFPEQHVFAPPALFVVCCFRLKAIVAVG